MTITNPDNNSIHIAVSRSGSFVFKKGILNVCST